MTPEEKARVKIDEMFEDAGWKVVDRDHFSTQLYAMAVKEGLMKGHKEADYLLFLGGKAVGVLEAKKEEIDVLSSVVEEQAEYYAHGVPSWCQAVSSPLPLVYVSNGNELYYKDLREQNSDYNKLSEIFSPKEVVKILGLQDYFAGLPILSKKGLRDCQYEAITNLEESFRNGQKRALLVLATGSGKTYTACMISYRMLAYTPARHVLFLVDRNNLGKQADGEFGTFRLTENGEAFNNIYGVERLKSSRIPIGTNVIIATIQRLFSLLTGQQIIDNDDEDAFQKDSEDAGPAIEMGNDLKLPVDYFDLIVIDECHRSIYGKWKKVLEYFKSARMIGLTATPATETLAFFNNNRVANYTLEKSIADGVNVDYRVFRIKTKVTEDGGAIKEGEKVTQITKYNGEVEAINTSETNSYSKEELNRSIVNPSQIKLILETYRDSIYSELYPDREANMDYIPKTLIFALNDAHAKNIVTIAKDVFGRSDDDFVQRITYSAGDSNELIRKFRNDRNFRIAVTVTLVATGTDIKPLEVVMFMRDVESDSLYIQMKGRGVRTIGDEQLRNVTPNALSKDLFYVIDAVGATEHIMSQTHPGDITAPNIPLKILFEFLAHGNVQDDLLRLLASRLSRIYAKADNTQRTEFASKAGVGMKALAVCIFDALENKILPVYTNINDPNTERKNMVKPLTDYPDAREYLLYLNAGFIKVLMPGEDKLIEKGFSKEEAFDTTRAFEQYVKAHRDDIEALRIIYNNENNPITYSMLENLRDKLMMVSHKFNPIFLWNNYAVLNPTIVKQLDSKIERDALTNIIQLVRYAYKNITELHSLYSTAAQRFELWCGQMQRTMTEGQKSIIKMVVNYIVANGSYTMEDIKQEDTTLAANLVSAFGTMKDGNNALSSLSKFILKAA